MTINAALRTMASTRDLKVGHYVCEFTTPGIGHILANAGCEYIFLDGEHSGLGFDSIKATLRYLQAANLPVIVRMPSKDYHHAARTMDLGADGLMIPMVNSAEEAASIVAHMKYAPEGKRGAAFGFAGTQYTLPKSVPDAMATANKNTVFFPQIETKEGADAAYEIAAVPGVDCLWVGHTDLSISLGIPGEYDHPVFVAAIDRVLDACRKNNVSTGILVTDVEGSIARYKQGFDFICYETDVTALGTYMRAGVKAIREGV